MASRTISSPINLAAVALAILASAVALLLTEPASAHANLIEASPKPSEELDAPPERVIIWFTEPIEPAFSSIKVLSASGEDVTAGATQFDATEPTAMWVPLATLENGTFTVVWRNVSSVDGHKVTRLVPFRHRRTARSRKSTRRRRATFAPIAGRSDHSLVYIHWHRCICRRFVS